MEFEKNFKAGIKDSIPIALGYFAVSFSLGIAARNAGLSALQGFLLSFFNNASAGEYAAITTIAADASYFEIAIITLIANARYLLMSCSLSQKFSPDLPLYHRFLIGFDVTDELFGIAIARPGMLSPLYSYSSYILPLLSWSIGTMSGVIAGNILPSRIVSALSIALYGMFLAIIVPPARKDRVIAVLIVISFLLSYICTIAPVIRLLSSGTRTIILTVIISAGAAFLFPIKEN